MDESVLLNSILHRDKGALAVFYRQYAPKLLAYIRIKIQNPGDAEEIMQDTLFSFLEALRDYTGKSSINTFLFSICNHKIVDFYRRKKIIHTVFSRTPMLEEIVSPILRPDEALDMLFLKEKIRKVLDGLLPQYKKVLVLRYIEYFSVVEIAKKCETTLKSAESQLFRARKAFVEVFLST